MATKAAGVGHASRVVRPGTGRCRDRYECERGRAGVENVKQLSVRGVVVDPCIKAERRALWLAR